MKMTKMTALLLAAAMALTACGTSHFRHYAPARKAKSVMYGI